VEVERFFEETVFSNEKYEFEAGDSVVVTIPRMKPSIGNFLFIPFPNADQNRNTRISIYRAKKQLITCTYKEMKKYFNSSSGKYEIEL